MTGDEVESLDVIFFSNRFVEWICTGKKTATTRVDSFVFDDGDVEKVGHLKQGDLVRAVDDDNFMFAIIEIVNVERRALKSLDNNLARIENFDDVSQLKEALGTFYSDLTEDSPLVVIYFNLNRVIKK